MALLEAFRPISTRPSVLRHRSKAKQKVNEQPSQGPSPSPASSEEEDENIRIRPSKHTPKTARRIKGAVSSGGPSRPFRLLRQDFRNLRGRYVSDWTIFKQLIFASAVYVFFTNLLPGITFASDLCSQDRIGAPSRSSSALGCVESSSLFSQTNR
jgi:hypothetical protein